MSRRKLYIRNFRPIYNTVQHIFSDTTYILVFTVPHFCHAWRSIEKRTLGGTQYRNTAKKLANTEIPCQKSTKYRYLNYDRTHLLKAVFISRVCLPQACMHQKSTSDIGRKREKTLIGSTIKKPGHWMPFQFCHRLYNHLPLLV